MPRLRIGQHTLDEVRTSATVDTADRGNITIGVALGPRRCIADQLLAKVDVIQAVRERIQLCQETVLAVLRESLRVSRINHIFRVRGHTILNEEASAKTFAVVGQMSIERLFPGITEDSAQQATLSGGQSGIGCKRSVDVVRPAHMGALVAAKPRVRDMIRDSTSAGLLPEQHLLAPGHPPR